MAFLASLFNLFGCESSKKSDTKTNFTYEIDIDKRNALVKKYNLLNWDFNEKRIFFTVDEFFDGNYDDASIAPNLQYKPTISEYYKIIKEISKHPKITNVLIELKDVNIYQDNELSDSDWVYTDMIYFIGEITNEELNEKIKTLKPDEVEYTIDNEILSLDSSYNGKKIIYAWWD